MGQKIEVSRSKAISSFNKVNNLLASTHHVQNKNYFTYFYSII